MNLNFLKEFNLMIYVRGVFFWLNNKLVITIIKNRIFLYFFMNKFVAGILDPALVELLV